MKRLFDLFLAIPCIVLLTPLGLIISIAIKLDSEGPIFHLSDRIGKRNIKFKMVKFRTMYANTPQVATHLLGDPKAKITRVGRFLRQTSLDEVPQLWNILVGEMSLVGPRPALFNQQDLIDLRTLNSVHTILPGVTGWAQINGRDSISIVQKVQLDQHYLCHQSISFDVRIIFRTIIKIFNRENIAH